MSYTTTQFVQEELRATAPFSNSTVPSLQSVQRWIDEESIRFDTIAGTVASLTTYTEYIDYEGSDIILLKNSPIVSVSSISYNTNPIGSSLGVAWETKTAETDYTVYEGKGKILLLPLNFSPTVGAKRFKIVYSAGYSSTPKDVQALVTKMVALRVLDTLIHSNINESNDGGEVSVGSIRIVEPGSYGVNSYMKLKTDIELMTNQITNGSSVYRYTW